MTVWGWDTVKSDISNQGGRITTIETNYATKASVTAATKPKITYNSQGIVTGGSGLDPVDIPTINIGTQTTGTLAVNRGGTGVTSLTARRVLQTNSAGNIA
jgi:hypothetical protein